MEDNSEIRFKENVRALTAVVDEVKQCLEKVSCSLKEIVPFVTVGQLSQCEPVRTFGLQWQDSEKAEEKEERHKEISNETKQENFHRTWQDRPLTPIAKISNDVQEWVKTRQMKNKGVKKEKEWLFSSPIEHVDVQYDEDHMCWKESSSLQNISPKSPASCVSVHNKPVNCSFSLQAVTHPFDSGISHSASSDVESCNIGSPDRNDLKFRYVMESCDPADFSLQTLMNIKESDMNPSLQAAESSVFTEIISGEPSFVHSYDVCQNSISSDFIVDMTDFDKCRNQVASSNEEFIKRKNDATTQIEYSAEFSLSLPAIEEKQISRVDGKCTRKPFESQSSSWRTISENKETRNSTNLKHRRKAKYDFLKSRKHLNRGRLAILGSSNLNRQKLPSCRKKQVYCKFLCGCQFDTKQLSVTKEGRKSLTRMGLVRQLVDKWENQYVKRFK